MAISANCVWEVRPTNGSDTNGGGFVIGASGTDWSQQNSTQYSVTDGVTNGTTTLTSATANFGTDVVGNIIYISGGTGSVTPVRRQITSRTNATTIVVDSATGLTAGTGVTLKIGGAVQTLTPVTTAFVAGNRAYIKGESTLACTASNTFPSVGGTRSRITGYTSVRGDGGQFTIQLSTNTGLNGIAVSNGYLVENITVDANSLGTSTCFFNTAGSMNMVRNCVAKNFTSAGINAISFIEGCEITGGTSAATAAVVSPVSVNRSHIHDNACLGISFNAAGAIHENKIINNTGASSDGILSVSTGPYSILNNTIHGSGRDGIRLGNVQAGYLIKSNLLSSNAGYGLRSTSAMPASPLYDGNAYWNNTTGTRNGVGDTSGINAVGAYTNVMDVVISSDPYVNSGAENYALNNTASAGASLRGTAPPSSWPNSSEVGYGDFGAIHSQAAATGGFKRQGMGGGVSA